MQQISQKEHKSIVAGQPSRQVDANRGSSRPPRGAATINADLVDDLEGAVSGEAKVG